MSYIRVKGTIYKAVDDGNWIGDTKKANQLVKKAWDALSSAEKVLGKAIHDFHKDGILQMGPNIKAAENAYREIDSFLGKLHSIESALR